MGDAEGLIFGLTVYREPAGQLDWCLGHIRAAYPAAAVFVIADGTDRPDWRDVCAAHRADYRPGERLKVVSRGAEWWQRFFTTALTYAGGIVFKIDPDTQVHRPFAFYPAADVFGSVEWTGNVQGGIQGMRREAVEKIVAAGVCLDPAYRNPATWADNPDVRAYVRAKGEMSTDHTLRHIVRRIGLTVAPWPEVDSHWAAGRPFRPSVAATHPHKWA